MKYRAVARRLPRLAAGVALAILTPASIGYAQAPEKSREISLDSLLNTRISTAAKYLQTTAEAAASVTIITGDEIRLLGYSDLQEVLESIPGMYVSNDRNYPYLGTRGFGRPGDYNNRILLLIDGHTMNEQVWGGVGVGSDMPLNLDAVERIEVVRGPGSALYGTSAMFAVINIVSRNGKQQSGGTVSGRVGSGTDRQIAANIGYAINQRASFAISALANESNGPTLYFPEFRNDARTGGTVRDLDWERRASITGSLVAGNVTTRIGYRGRTKGIPTGSYETTFGDTRERTFDGSAWADVSFRSNPAASYQINARLYADHAKYNGEFPYIETASYTDRGISTSIGGEATGTWDLASRYRLALGTEIRRMVKAEYIERTDYGMVQGTNAPHTVASLYAQNELDISRGLKLVGGVRYDRKVGRWHALMPRIAAVFMPDDATTFKLLYGEAFRAPSVSEGDLESEVYNRNVALKPERIATYEAVIERRIASSLLIGVSGYHYAIRNLIEQVESDTATGIRFENLNAVRGRGVEFTANLQPAGGPLSVRAWYNLQRTRDKASLEELTNSPRRAGSVALLARMTRGAHAAVSIRHESGRLQQDRMLTKAFNRVDLNTGFTTPQTRGPVWLRAFDFSLRTINLFDARYSVPAGLEHVQQSLEQNRRTFSFRVRRGF